jgi:hypothetical protein
MYTMITYIARFMFAGNIHVSTHMNDVHTNAYAYIKIYACVFMYVLLFNIYALKQAVNV